MLPLLLASVAANVPLFVSIFCAESQRFYERRRVGIQSAETQRVASISFSLSYFLIQWYSSRVTPSEHDFFGNIIQDLDSIRFQNQQFVEHSKGVPKSQM